MTGNAKNMRKVIHRISALNALRRARELAIVLLLLFFVYQVYFHIPVTALILALCYTVLPSIVRSFYAGKSCGGESKELSQLQKKFQYGKVEYTCQSITFILMVCLVGCWQYAVKRSSVFIGGTIWYPMCVQVVIFLVFLYMYTYYRIKLPVLVKNNLV